MDIELSVDYSIYYMKLLKQMINNKKYIYIYIYIKERPTEVQTIITEIPQAQIITPINVLFNRIKRV
jgi:hypothetical protein